MAKRKVDFDTVLGKIHREVAVAEAAEAENGTEAGPLAPTLNETERQRLEKCETIIQRGLEVFLQVGQALFQIRSERLYRAEYATFENYCRDKWNLSRIHVHRIIDASEVVLNLMPVSRDRLPENEKQARPLSSLPPDDQKVVWGRILAALDTGSPKKITGKLVETFVTQFKREKDREARLQNGHLVPELLEGESAHESAVPGPATPQEDARALKQAFARHRDKIILQVPGSVLIEENVAEAFTRVAELDRPVSENETYYLLWYAFK